MKSRILSLALLAILAAPAALFAQEEGEEGYKRGQLFQVSTWEVDPADARAFENTAKQIAEAAGTSNIGWGYRWGFWQQASQFTLVRPVVSFGYFDEPGQFMLAFEGTEGEDQMTEAFAQFPKIRSRTVMEEIAEVKNDWSYRVDSFDFDNMRFAHIDVIWPRSGMDEEFEKLNKEWVSFFKDLEYPYPYDANQVHFGDTGRTVYVTFIDDLAAYYGENELMKLVEAKNMGERSEQLDDQFNAVTARWEHYNITYRPDMSYWPEPPQQATN